MTNNPNFEKAVDLIQKSTNVLITTHTRPDGDACGSIAALSETLTALGKNVDQLFLSKIPEWYEFLFTQKTLILGRDVTIDELKHGRLAAHDLIIIVDTNSKSQLQDFAELLEENTAPVLVFDHHVTSDGLGDVELIDASAAAAALIVFDLLKHAALPITEAIAQAVFVAAATDTGWFQFTNTDARVHRVCAELVDAGANPTQIYHNLYQNFSFGRLKLMTAMLNTLELHFDSRYATQYLRHQDFQKCGAEYSDTENLIDECRRLATVQAAALFVELKDGRVKCSLRSTSLVDVRKIAQKFGGGGHKMASGLHLDGPIEKAKELINAEIEKQFQE